MRRSTLALVLAGAMLFAAGAASLIADISSHDFPAFYAAARLVALGQGPEITDPAAILAMEQTVEPRRDVILPWVHLPAIALLLSPLGALPFLVAAGLMAALDTLCLVWSLRRLSSIFPNMDHRPLLFVIAATAPPAIAALTLGQTTPWLLALVVAALSTKSPFGRGLALGLTMIRPQTAVLFAIAGMTSRRSAIGVLAGWGILGIASLTVVGPAGMVTYAQQLVGAASWSVTGEYGMRIAVGWPSVGIALGHPAIGFALAIASLVLGAVVVASSSGRDRIIAAAAWCLIGTPHAQIPDAVVTYPAVAALASRSNVAAVVVISSGYLAMVVQANGLPVAPLWIVGLALATVVAGAVQRAHGCRGGSQPPPAVAVP
jgi:hypothetical protein